MAVSAGKRRALFAIGGTVAASVIIVLALALFFDLNGYRPRLENAASKALGLEVRIGGEMNLVFFPPLGFSLTDLHVTRREEEVLRVERMRVGLKILPLLLGRVRFRALDLVRPALFIRRTAGGPFDFDRYLARPLRSAREGLPGAFGRIDGVSITGGTAAYTGKDDGIRFDAEEIDLVIRDLALPGSPGEDPLRNLSFTGTGKAARASVGGVEAERIAFGLTAKDGNYEINPIALQAFGGSGEGNLWVSLTEPTPLVQVQFSLTGSRAERFFAGAGRTRALLEGAMDLSANLFLKGGYADEGNVTMSGDLSWKGSDLAVNDADPDALLSAGKEGKEIPLARMGALLLPDLPFREAAQGLAGPDIPPGKTGDRGTVVTLLSDWTVKNGVFEANDVAFSTKRYRVALAGRIDLPAGQFDGITAALVDDRGCAAAGQAIQGPFLAPRITDATFVREKTAAGKTPAGTTAKPAPKEGCEVFYEGSVPPPQ